MQGKDNFESKYLKQVRENGIYGMGGGIALGKSRDSLSTHGKLERK